MSEFIERVAFAIFLSRYPEGSAPAPESREFWPDRLDELVSGPPFDAEGYREMARAAIAAMEQPSVDMLLACDTPVGDYWSPKECWQAMITAAMKPD